MKQHRCHLWWILLALATHVGCISSPSLQTGRTLEPGQGRTYLGINMYTSPSINEAVNNNTRFDRGDIRDYSLIFGHKRGVVPNFDMGVRVSFVGSAGFDGKYRFFQGAAFNAASGFDLNYASITTGDGDARADIDVIDYTIPLYLSYDMSATLALYTVPRYIIRKVTGDVSGTQVLFGYTVGMKSAGTAAMAFEITQIQGKIQQFSLAYFFNDGY